MCCQQSAPVSADKKMAELLSFFADSTRAADSTIRAVTKEQKPNAGEIKGG
jgi:hypothetical protein